MTKDAGWQSLEGGWRIRRYLWTLGDPDSGEPDEYVPNAWVIIMPGQRDDALSIESFNSAASASRTARMRMMLQVAAHADG